MPPRSQFLSATALVSLLTLGSLWHFRGDDPEAGSSKTPSGLVASSRPSALRKESGGKLPVPGSFGRPTGNRAGSALAPLYNQASGALPAGASAHNGFSRIIPPEPLVKPISEEELQWRAAKVEQAANHDLKHLVALLDLDQNQQDRIFQTLARRSPDWHPQLQPAIVGADMAEIRNPSGNHHHPQPHLPDALDSPGSPSAVPVSPPAVENSTSSGHTMPTFPAETPLVEALAPDLTPAQQVELAEDELDRLEWWESIIPRLLPGEEESGAVYAVPPETLTPVESVLSSPVALPE